MEQFEALFQMFQPFMRLMPFIELYSFSINKTFETGMHYSLQIKLWSVEVHK